MDWFLILFGLGLALMIVGPALLILVSVMRRSTLSAFLAGAATLAGLAWWIELYRAMTGAGDLDGMFDCYPDCSTSQETAMAILGYLPMAMGAVLLLVLVAATIRHLRHLGQA
jgi:hypothetical protein